MKVTTLVSMLIGAILLFAQPINAQKKEHPKKNQTSQRDSLTREEFFKMKLSLTAAEYQPFVAALQTHQKATMASKQLLKEKRTKKKSCTDKEELKKILREIQSAENKIHESKLQFQIDCIDILGVERAKQIPALQKEYQQQYGKKKGKQGHEKKQNKKETPKK